MCEPNRERSVCVVFLANTCLIGNPTLIEGAGPEHHTMQMMRVDTEEWIPLPPITPVSDGSCKEAINSVIVSGAHMPESVPIRHSDEIKAEAKSRYWHVQIPPSAIDRRDGKHTAAQWRAIVNGAISWNPQESYEQTMDRLQPIVEKYLGVSLADKAGVVKAAKAIGRLTKGKSSTSSQTEEADTGNGATTPPVSTLNTDTQMTLMSSIFSTSCENFDGNKPSSMKTPNQLLAKDSSWATLEPYSYFSNALKECGVLPKSAKTLTSSFFETVKVYKDKGRGPGSFGFCAKLPLANMDYTNSSTTPLAAHLSYNVFDGKRMLDKETMVERIVFPDKKSAIRTLLVIGILTKGRASPTAGASIVEKLMRQGGIQSPWQGAESKVLRVLVQSCKEKIGYIVTEGDNAWFVFESPLGDSTKKQGKLLFYEFATKQGPNGKAAARRQVPKRSRSSSGEEAFPDQTDVQLDHSAAVERTGAQVKKKRKRRKKRAVMEVAAV
jgi:hypothetical protein